MNRRISLNQPIFYVSGGAGADECCVAFAKAAFCLAVQLRSKVILKALPVKAAILMEESITPISVFQRSMEESQPCRIGTSRTHAGDHRGDQLAQACAVVVATGQQANDAAHDRPPGGDQGDSKTTRF